MGNPRHEQVNLEQWEKKSFSKKTKVFIENVKKAIRDAIATASIAVSTIIPSSFETLSYTTAFTGAALVTACCDKPDTTPPTIDIPKREIPITKPEILRVSGNQVYLWNTVVATCNDPESGVAKVSFSVDRPGSTSTQTTISGSCTVRVNANNTENLSQTDTFKINYIDNTKPEFSIHESSIDVSQWDKITMSDKQVFIWWKIAFARNNDNYVATFKLKLNNDNYNETIELPFTLGENGDYILECILTNKNNWQSVSKTTTIKVEKTNQAPEITREYDETKVPNILWWITINMVNNQLLFWDIVIYKWKDDSTENLDMKLILKYKESWKQKESEIKSWETIKIESWWKEIVCEFTETDKELKTSSVTFPIRSESVDLSSINNIQIDHPVDLVPSIPNGIEVTKVEVEINWERHEVDYNEWHNTI